MFQTYIFAPLYNLLVYIVNFLPGHEVWLAVALLTLLVKIALIPLYRKQIRTQYIMSHAMPKIKAIQEKYKDKKDTESQQALAKETMSIWSEYKMNPLTPFLILIIQMPILIALYRIFFTGIEAHRDLLYTNNFIPEILNQNFFGIALSSRSLLLALLAGVTMFALNWIMMQHKDKIMEESEFQKSMNLQMQYVLPIVIGVVSYVTPAVVAIYIVVGNLFGIAQEYFIRRPLEKRLKVELAAK
jgi:YidC/Oxa1 family membrane protein insertase